VLITYLSIVLELEASEVVSIRILRGLMVVIGGLIGLNFIIVFDGGVFIVV
jgi:hypothetical protein